MGFCGEVVSCAEVSQSAYSGESPTLPPGNPHPYPINKPNSPVSRVDSYFGLSPYEDGGDIVCIPPGEEFL